MSFDPQRATDLSVEAKRALLAQLLKQKGATPSSCFPLSFAQQRLWYLDQLEPGSAAYHLPLAVRLKGPLNVAALEEACVQILARHESLRTTFELVEGEPRQRIAPPAPFKLEMESLQSVAPEARDAEVRRRVREQALKPFNLATGPLWRIKLYRLAADEHVVFVCMHHIISDGWSRNVFVNEMAALYRAFSSGSTAALPELPIQYVDFAQWQRNWLQGEVLDRQLAYWKKQLAGLGTLQLPLDRPRPPVQTYRGARMPFHLTPDLTQKLQALSQREAVTLFMTLLAAFQTLLHRHARQTDIAVGTPIANRTRRETEGLIGFFANTLVMRTDFSGDPTFRELLQRVRETALGAYAHQDLPFERLVEELQPERDLSRSPLFQVMFILQNTPKPPAEDQLGLAVSVLESEGGTAMFDMTLSLTEAENGGLTGFLEYNTDLFEPATITRWLARWQTLLAGIVTDPNQRVSRLPVLPAAEREQLLVAWNATDSPYPEVCLHELLAAQAAATPAAVAAVFEQQELTYAELNARANQLAHHLRGLGLQPEELVGICVERSLDMLVALLGILKAGGAYVPLDPSFPPDRLAFMVTDAGLRFLVTQSTLLESLPEHNAELVCLDTDWDFIEGRSRANPANVNTPAHLAYVIYTSGSTGTPKGVQISHKAVVNFLHAMRQRPGLTATDVLLAVTTLSFDIAGLELYLPLLVGGRVVIASREVAGDGNALLDLLTRSQATVMQATPATWRLLLAAGWEHGSSLKVLCGGEALPRELALQLRERSSSLWNMYGPTETTIWSTLHQVEPGNAAIVIGRPIANTQVYILDAHLQPVPIGVMGDLYLGGDGLARGYWRRPELTAEKFIPHPFARTPGERLYKTGDLARYLADGTIDFLGRSDHQVKVRGFRIELEEIEAVLNQHPAVQAAVVVAREDVPGDQRLVAYLISRGPQAAGGSELRTFLRLKLPDYMLPSAYVTLPAFPLTPNGKVDRRRLPPPEGRVADEVPTTYVAPRTPMEKLIAQVWREALKIEHVGVHDNFFDLGGHSLLSMQVIARLEKATGRRLHPRDMILQTVEQLATILEARQAAPASKGAAAASV
ncbi:MAG: amino acid adenylation domain-containing protein [candidate division KSB1 bacterium]|nr:amino acid adenylation domain-containing protein [candidate division KSB1 bacterium]MDZ7275815.1 amino acid adenylation domain-containing protein [candidate division KSB1 bacterium]MDZ7287566.1 amino acid adenylation domain-containing protein [candidate division KSB1 bacterium]MDZ7308030.1 amino acid adenylation domain-containing protein [candidate division KSB1 bacterium]MDZ7350544.1 amino acid adenylation domain-containing protein [candidate division KSB1 bacterium]